MWLEAEESVFACISLISESGNRGYKGDILCCLKSTVLAWPVSVALSYLREYSLGNA